MNEVKRLLRTLVISLAFLPACAQLGLETPETFADKLAVGYGSVTTARATAKTLVSQKVITPDDAQNVQDQADNFRAGLDIARKIQTTDPTTAAAKLNAVTLGLAALTDYLATKRK